jgi:formylmethanofuran dehydrogenase subunit C
MKHKVLQISILAFIVLGFSSCISVSVLPGGTPRSGTQPQARSMDLGAIKVDNNASITLKAGTYTGRLVVNANNATISGAGIGKTIINGDVAINGNANKIRGVTIQGAVNIDGNTNDLTGSQVNKSKVSAKGNNNRY